jgi:hypothetical protein
MGFLLRSGGRWAYHYGMRAITGTVTDGRIEIPAELVAEGTPVVVLAPESGEPILLTPVEERELLEAMEDIRRGDYVDGEDLLNELRSLRS